MAVMVSSSTNNRRKEKGTEKRKISIRFAIRRETEYGYKKKKRLFLSICYPIVVCLISRTIFFPFAVMLLTVDGNNL